MILLSLPENCQWALVLLGSFWWWPTIRRQTFRWRLVAQTRCPDSVALCRRFSPLSCRALFLWGFLRTFRASLRSFCASNVERCRSGGGTTSNAAQFSLKNKNTIIIIVLIIVFMLQMLFMLKIASKKHLSHLQIACSASHFNLSAITFYLKTLLHFSWNDF